MHRGMWVMRHFLCVALQQEVRAGFLEEVGGFMEMAGWKDQEGFSREHKMQNEPRGPGPGLVS